MPGRIERHSFHALLHAETLRHTPDLRMAPHIDSPRAHRQ